MYGDIENNDGNCIGMGVRWVGEGRAVEGHCFLLDSLVTPTKQVESRLRSEWAVRFDQVPSSEFAKPGWDLERRIFSDVFHEDQHKLDQYKNSHRFVALKLAVRRPLVCIRSYFACREDAEAISNLTAYRTEDNHDKQEGYVARSVSTRIPHDDQRLGFSRGAETPAI